MIELTDEQRQTLADKEPPQLLDPKTQKTYVLISEELYQRLQAMLVDEDSAEEIYPRVMEVFGREGRDDPAMDIYNDLDPRNQ